MKTIKTVGDLKNTKIYLCCPEGRRKFQEHCFKLGIRWIDGGDFVRYLEEGCYNITSNLRLSWITFSQFTKKDSTQVFLENVLSIPVSEKE